MKDLLKKIVFAGIVSTFVFSAAITVSAQEGSVTSTDSTKACTQEAKLCPDGKTYVSRTGPNCEFASCKSNVTECPELVKKCPDGTYIGPTGPNCEFKCPVVCGTCLKVTPPSPRFCQVGNVIPIKNMCGCVTGYTCGKSDDLEKTFPVKNAVELQKQKMEAAREEQKRKAEAVREQWKEQREEAKQKLEGIKWEYKAKLESIKTERKEFTDSIKAVGVEKLEIRKKEIKNKAIEKANKVLQNATGAMINRLEALKNKVDGAKLLDADKATIKTEIDTDINWLKTKTTEVGATASTSATTTKIQTQEVRDYWDKVKTTVKRVSGEILAGRLNYIVSRTETLASTLATDIAALKTAGKDVVAIEAKLNDAKAKIPAVKQKIADAVAKFKLITSLDTAKTNYEAGQALIREAKAMLNDVHVALVQVRGAASSLAGINGNSCPSASVVMLNTNQEFATGYTAITSPEKSFVGLLIKNKKSGANSVTQREYSYSLNGVNIYTKDDLSGYVGKRVILVGKNYRLELEGATLDEIWPKSISCDTPVPTTTGTSTATTTP